jgi:hypothetical protein
MGFTYGNQTDIMVVIIVTQGFEKPRVKVLWPLSLKLLSLHIVHHDSISDRLMGCYGI